MRKLVAGLLMSLDGVVESPNVWGWPRYMNDEMSQAIVAGIAQADAVLLGRRTYLEFARIWPDQGSDVPMADFLNNAPKYVVSTTLRAPLEWENSHLLTGDLAQQLNNLKRQAEDDPGSWEPETRALLACGRTSRSDEPQHLPARGGHR